MEHELEIKHNGKTEKVSVETSVYQGRQTYEVCYAGQFIVIFKEGGKWQQDSDHDFDEEWLTSVGKAIERHPDINANINNSSALS